MILSGSTISTMLVYNSFPSVFFVPCIFDPSKDKRLHWHAFLRSTRSVTLKLINPHRRISISSTLSDFRCRIDAYSY